MKIKVNNKMLKDFLAIADNCGEFLFYETENQLKKQLEIVLNCQGYWSGCYYRIYYNEKTKSFTYESKSY